VKGVDKGRQCLQKRKEWEGKRQDAGYKKKRGQLGVSEKRSNFQYREEKNRKDYTKPQGRKKKKNKFRKGQFPVFQHQKGVRVKRKGDHPRSWGLNLNPSVKRKWGRQARPKRKGNEERLEGGCLKNQLEISGPENSMSNWSLIRDWRIFGSRSLAKGAILERFNEV